MIRRLARQAAQLLGDKQLRPYWSSRGLIASLFFLFGILLRESGYQATEVLGAWVLVYLSQAALLLSLDRLVKHASPRRHQAVIISCALGACASTVGMILLGTQLALFSITTILLLPLWLFTTKQSYFWVFLNLVHWFFLREGGDLGAIKQHKSG